MYTLLHLISKILIKISNLVQSFAMKFESTSYHNKGVIASTVNYNMVNELNEKYYLDQYWKFLLPHIQNMENKIVIYDLGCGQGRFSIKLASYFKECKLYGCDFSKVAIDYAKNLSLENKLNDRIDFTNEKIINFIEQKKTNSADLIIITEVLFYYPNWQDDIDKIIALLKPGGKIIISFRSQYFNLLNSVYMKNFNKIEMILEKRQGNLFNDGFIYTWNTSEEIKEIIKSKKLYLEALYGIGSLSGIKGDPMHNICEPAQITLDDQKKLMGAENILGKNNLDSCRYLLTISNKPHD